MALRFIEGLAADFAGREHLPLLKRPIMAVTLSFDQSSIKSSRRNPTLSAALERQGFYHAHSSSHSMTMIDSFTNEHTVCICQNEPSQHGLYFVINSRLSSQPALASFKQMDPTSASSTTTLPKTQPSIQIAANTTMNISPPASESDCLLKRESNCSFLNPVFISSVLSTRIPFQELLQKLPNSRHALGGLGFASRDQTSTYELFQTITEFARRFQ